MDIGSVVANRYVISRWIARGGMATVYAARDQELDRPVAIKAVNRLTADPVEQVRYEEILHREALLLGKLDHPGLAQVLDYGWDGGSAFMVMELIEGPNLESYVAAAAGPPQQSVILDWTEQLCDVLAYLHGQSPPVIVRDLKPANILLRPSGRLCLVDFGLARKLDPGSRTHTLIRQLGTEGFAPIEQYRISPTDERSDLYSLGATLWFMATRRVPPSSPQRAVGAKLGDPRALNPTLSRRFITAMWALLQVWPSHRPQSIAEFKELLTSGKGAPLPPMEPESVPDTVSDLLPRAQPSSTGSLRKTQVLEGHTGIICGISYSQDGSRLLTASLEGGICLWKGDKLMSELLVEEGLCDVRLAPLGQAIAAITIRGQLMLGEPENGKLRVISRVEPPVKLLSFSPDGLLAVHHAGYLTLLDVRTGEVAASQGPGLDLTAMQFSPVGRHLAVGHRNGTAELRHPQNLRVQRRQGEGSAITALAYSPDGQQLLVARAGEIARGSQTLDMRKTFSDYHDVRAVTVTARGLWMVSDGPHLRIIDGDRGLELMRTTYPFPVLAAVPMHGRQLVAADGRRVDVWDITV